MAVEGARKAVREDPEVPESDLDTKLEARDAGYLVGVQVGLRLRAARGHR